MQVRHISQQPDINVELRLAFQAEGIASTKSLCTERAEAVLLDLPDHPQTLQQCRRLREVHPRLPIVAIDRSGDACARVEILKAGADDCVSQPIDPAELALRIRLRANRGVDTTPQVLSYSDVTIDRGLRQAWRGGRRLSLTPTEFALLEALIERPEEILERRYLYRRAWGYDFGGQSNPLGVYIGYLRRKLERDGAARLIQTTRRVGYILSAPE